MPEPAPTPPAPPPRPARARRPAPGKCADWHTLSPQLQRALARADFTAPLQLLTRFPLRHEDWENDARISELRHNEIAAVEGEIIDAKTIPARGKPQYLVHLQDAKGDTLGLRFFNVTPGLKTILAIGNVIRARGKAKFAPRLGWEMSHPRFTTSAANKTVRAVYPAHKTLSSPQQQKLIAAALAHLPLESYIPQELAAFEGGDWTLKQSFAATHAPAADNTSPLDANAPAWRRLRFEELTAHQLILRRRLHRRAQNAPLIRPPAGWQARLQAALPFALTAAQQRAIDDIAADLARPLPMRRLLQGDVGSGKTAVAAAACLAVILQDGVAAFMAPTEILAQQHHATLSALMDKLNIHCELITGALSPKKRQEAENRLRFGLSSLAIGTHALFMGQDKLPRLALAVIDEQHRFGVEQRAQLIKKGDNTHQLMMSATPIPRTLALSLYADMEVSVLDEKPAGRRPVRTIVGDSERRQELIARAAGHIANGGRVYWVCPRIEEGDDPDSAKNLRDVQTLASEFSAAHPGIGAGILHGKMKTAEKNAVMDKFRAGKISLLAATTVIEVGVDVPQADVMLIDHACQLGLSQLHQLRGRVGRGERPGTCILLYKNPLSDEARERLAIMRASDDGFVIAQKDLAMRGPGEWIGSRQSGMPSLKIARLGQDPDIAAAARAAADWMLKNAPRASVLHLHRWLGRDALQAERRDDAQSA